MCVHVVLGSWSECNEMPQAFSTATVFPVYYPAGLTIMPYCFVCAFVCVHAFVCVCAGTMALCPTETEADVKAASHSVRDRKQTG